MLVADRRREVAEETLLRRRRGSGRASRPSAEILRREPCRLAPHETSRPRPRFSPPPARPRPRAAFARPRGRSGRPAEAGVPSNAHDRRRGRPARRHGPRPVPLAGGREEPRGPGLDEGAGRPHAAEARVAARARRDRRAAEGAALPRQPRRADPPRHALLLLAAARGPREIDRLLEGRRGRRREGPPRPERLVHGRQREPRGLERFVGRREGRVPEEGQQLRRGDALRHGRRDREGLGRGRHRGRQVRVGLVDARRLRLLLHEAARRSEDPGLRAAGLGGRPPAPDRDRPEDGRRREAEARRPDDVPERRDHARRALPLLRRLARLDVERDLVPRPRGESGLDGLDAAGNGRQGALRRGDVRPDALRPDGRRRAAGAVSSPSTRPSPPARRGRKSSPSGKTRPSRAPASSAGSSPSTT